MSQQPATDPSGDPLRVICVAYNPGDELRAFASSLARATTRAYELVIVDNGERTDAVVDLEASGAARVERHRDGNVGYGRAANAGAAGLKASWLVVANPDVVWEPGALDLLVEAGEADPTAGSLGPRVLNPDGTTYPSARALPSLAAGAGHALLHAVWPGNPWTRAYRQAQEAITATEPHAAGWLSGACLLLRRAAFEQVGGFDERYFMFFEDVDLGDRLGQAGWRNVYVPAARVTHLQGVSWKHSPAPMIRAHHASAKRYLFDRWGAWWQAPVRWAIGVGLAVRERVEVALSERERRPAR
ncbi:glycosyltransferase family 2 protein [Xylanimonas ulmi]|uniref:N-acetylglucosaminyl-diphospho-decaprenol L-rhamnosyltransferase n=1 Tax=Xylanimonas ulmi TaxID=228973 RepID=A0A4Q7LZV9_9MICO|nr:glycosyltransferase family 2 protein [Xylanibacterium ulmi]RZS59977.1 N-acetylglucosaminyl-diphospho-decaprenol L-rhamnosyltransferase [Xylanibacterium ulmi]